jgi:hypothetical protein
MAWTFFLVISSNEHPWWVGVLQYSCSKKMQMITILKQNTSLHNIKYLYPIKCIHKT